MTPQLAHKLALLVNSNPPQDFTDRILHVLEAEPEIEQIIRTRQPEGPYDLRGRTCQRIAMSSGTLEDAVQCGAQATRFCEKCEGTFCRKCFEKHDCWTR